MVKDKREIIHYLANKYNLPLSKIEEIVNHQFKVVAAVMSKGEFSTIRIPYFGKFSVKAGRLKYIKDKKKNAQYKK